MVRVLALACFWLLLCAVFAFLDIFYNIYYAYDGLGGLQAKWPKYLLDTNVRRNCHNYWHDYSVRVYE